MPNMPTPKKIIYVTRDIERAMGKEPGPDYMIVTNDTPYSRSIKERFPEYVFLVKDDKGHIMGTGELMEHPSTQSILSDKDAAIIIFKNTARIEPLVNGRGLRMLNPRASLSERIENKITQIDWLESSGEKFLPEHYVKLVKYLSWTEQPFVLQWAHGHTGDGTILVESDKLLQAIKNRFPERMARVTDYISGPSFTVNVIISKDKVIPANVSYQITGIKPFTENKFSTIGNDWALPNKLLSKEEIDVIHSMANHIGEKMRNEKWLGLFGLDLMKDEERNKIRLIEINARQPASTTLESILQSRMRTNGAKGLTTMEAHIMALKGFVIDEPIIKIDQGSQIVQRLTTSTRTVSTDKGDSLTQQGFEVVQYDNTDFNADLLRIMSNEGIMENHNTFNENGKKILSILTA